MKRAPATCWTIRKELTFLPSESQKERKEMELKKEFKVKMAESSQILENTLTLHIEEDDWIKNGINPKKFMSKYIVMKLLKYKNNKKSWKQPERNGTLLREEHPFQWHIISHLKPQRPGGRNATFPSARERNCQPWILYPSKMSFRKERE